MKHQLILSLALFLLSNPVIAQTGRNAAEANQNQQAMAANQAQLERDINELAVFKAKLTQFETAIAGKDASKVTTLKTGLLADMRREIEQSEMKIAQDKRELTQSKSEVAASGRETNRSRLDRATIDNDSKDGYDVRDDRRDKKDDKKDAKDDKKDMEKQIARTERQKQIYAALQAFTFSFDPSLQEKVVANKALLQEFASTMEADIAATKAEVAEDKREAAEDSKERREDRREKAEKHGNRRW